MPGTQKKLRVRHVSLLMMSRTHKIANLVGVPLPLVGLVVAIVLLWNRAIGPLELGLLIGFYVPPHSASRSATTACSPTARLSPHGRSGRSSP